MFFRTVRPSSRQFRGSRGPRRAAWRFAPRLVALEARALLSTITVRNDADSGAGSLRAAIAGASPGDTIDFAPGAYGTITLTSGPLAVPNINLTIRGPGAGKLTISGNDAYTVFDLGVQPGSTAAPASMTISGLTIADGNATSNDYGSGGGILTAVNLTLTGSVLEDNQAPLESGGGLAAGANDSGLQITINNDLFEGNTAGSAQVFTFQGAGGAIDAENGSIVSVNASTFIDNQSNAPQAQGGAIAIRNQPTGFSSYSGSLTVTDSTFRNNVADADSADGGFGGFSAAGGAIWTDPQVVVSIASSQFMNNEAEVDVSGSNAGTAAGGAIEVHPGVTSNPSLSPSPVTIANSVFSGNLAAGTGNSGSTGEGGAVDSGGVGGFGAGGTITISGSTFIANQAMGDNSGANSSFILGGPAEGGAINTNSNILVINADTFSRNEAVGGSGGSGVQYALGGAINSQNLDDFLTGFMPATTISNSLFTGNEAIGGTGVPSYQTYVDGGAVALQGVPTTVTDTRFIGNQALGSPGGTGVSQFPPAYGPLAIGGAVEMSGAALSIRGGVIAGNVAQGGQGADATRGPGGIGGYGWGGGIFIGGYGALTIDGTSILGNSAIGSPGGQGHANTGGAYAPGGSGGYGQGGGIYIYYGGSATISDAIIADNTARGGAAGQGTTPGVAGDAQGGGVFAYAATLKISDGLIAGNSAIGGAGGGAGEGGGVFLSGTGGNASLTDVLITLNAATGGSGGGSGYGGGLYIATGSLATLKNTRVIGNTASTSGSNVYGTYTIG